LICLLLFTVQAQSGQRPLTPQDAEYFERRVRPILVEHCLACHGPKKQMSGLRLDSRSGLLHGGDNGPAIHPGKPDQSTLILAVRHSGERKMPPKKTLSREQIEALTTWVKMGAPWPDLMRLASDPDAWKRHWAFQPVRRPSVPKFSVAQGIRNPIDAFLQVKLQAVGLNAATEADRRTLLRRLSYDLIGLPPIPEEIAEFENDPRPDAYERLVERLLASPQYGERWGRHWLDVARYADTKGYVFFEEAAFPWAWTYRDYMIRSFNEDRPYNRFLLEQIAADQLDLGHDKRPLTALGFLTLGGRFMNNVHDILDDRIDVVTRGLLGLTVTCARCHDHKFDPIPTKDYYSLYGVFASCQDPAVPPTFFEPARTAEYEKFQRELEAREKKLADFLDAKRKALIEGARKRVAEYLLAVHATRDVPDTREFMLIADGNDLNPAMTNRWRAQLRRSARTREPVFALWHALSALSEKDFTLTAAALLQSPPATINPLVLQVFREKPPRTINEAAQHYSQLLNTIEKKWQELNRPPQLPDLVEEKLRLAFHGPDAAANVQPGQMSELELLPDRASQGELQKLRNACQQWRVSGPGAPPRAMVLLDLPRPVEPRVFLRGNPGNLGEPVPRQFLAVLAGKDRQPFTKGSGRLELARAIGDPRNPLTARVLVNRVWLHHFGRGLVTTPGDFGLRSEPPSHPELLDYLAHGFVENGWSIKQLHRLILLSGAYRQQSQDRPEARRVDPDNVLLWHFPRRRLDFESMRDALLSVSARLERRIGGPSTSDLLSATANRRTLYGQLDRLNVPGLYRTFDFPSPDATSSQRVDTTVPQQALFLMNNPFAQDCARRVVQRIDGDGLKDTAVRIDRLYHHLLGRAPTPEEIKLARGFLTSNEVSWEQVAQALLLSNEFIFVD
jgi:hypothetical protein